jgi:ACS family D-galactonate transporter-like MFS transporter
MLTKRERWILALLVLSAFINYVDRANLSVGAASIQTELGLSDYQLGLLLSGFFWTYALLQLFAVAGLLVDRFHVGWVYAAGFFVWSAATAGTGISTGFATLFAMRLLLGAGESVAYPAYSRILASYPEQRRGFANSVIDAGTRTGPAFGTLLGGLLMARFGWRSFFLALGLGSMLWLVWWVFCMPRSWSVAGKEQQADAPGVRSILRERSAWFTFVGLFCGNYFWYFLVTWLPAYLEKERHFAASKMAVWGALAFLAAAISTVICGSLSDFWIARGGTPTFVRRAFTGTGLALAIIIVPVAFVKDDAVAMAFLLTACLFIGMWSSNVWAITQTLAGPHAAGKWCAVQNGVGNLAGVTAPWLTGWLVGRTGHFSIAFVLSAVIALAGSAIYLFAIGPVKQVAFAPKLARVGVSARKG